MAEIALPARKVGCMFGAPTLTSVPFVACSLAAGDIAVSVDGVGPFPISPASIGGGVGYVGNSLVTDLSPLTRYHATITQNGNTESQYFWTAPEPGDDFCFLFAGCDNNTGLTSRPDGRVVEYSKHGGWKQYRGAIDENGCINGLPCIGVLFVDDLGYVDGMKPDRITGANPSSIIQAASIATEAAFAIAWLSNFGLYDTDDDYAKWARYPDRMWCYANLNRFPQWGDHEFRNDIGWEHSITDTISSPPIATVWANGKACWNAFQKPLQGSTDGFVDTTANHWYLDLGDVRILTADPISNTTAQVTNHLPGTETVIPNLFGNQQVDDLLTAAKSNHAFKVFGLQHSIKYMTDESVATDAEGELSRGAQHPLKNHVPAEYSRMFTAKSGGVNQGPVKSLMNSPETNGIDGTFFTLHGDLHAMHVYKHEAAGDADNVAEWFYEIGIGTTNGSVNHAIQNGAQVGESHDGTSVEFLHGGGIPNRHYGTVMVSVYGNRTPKEAHVELQAFAGVSHLDETLDRKGTWPKKFVHRLYRNDAVDMDTPVAHANGHFGSQEAV